MLKELQYCIWEIYFRIEVNAKFLLEMIHAPEIPNAPMMHWLLYIQLFDFDLVHIPAEKHKVPDGLSRRKPSPLDSDDEDAEAYLDSCIGASRIISYATVAACNWAQFQQTKNSCYVLLVFNTEFFMSFLEMQQHTPPRSGVTFATPTSTLELSYFTTVPNERYVTGVSMIEEQHGATVTPDRLRHRYKQSLVMRSLLSTIDEYSYMGYEFTI
jgi:hypothetical protein